MSKVHPGAEKPVETSQDCLHVWARAIQGQLERSVLARHDVVESPNEAPELQQLPQLCSLLHAHAYDVARNPQPGRRRGASAQVPLHGTNHLVWREGRRKDLGDAHGNKCLGVGQGIKPRHPHGACPKAGRQPLHNPGRTIPGCAANEEDLFLHLHGAPKVHGPYGGVFASHRLNSSGQECPVGSRQVHGDCIGGHGPTPLPRSTFGFSCGSTSERRGIQDESENPEATKGADYLLPEVTHVPGDGDASWAAGLEPALMRNYVDGVGLVAEVRFAGLTPAGH